MYIEQVLHSSYGGRSLRACYDIVTAAHAAHKPMNCILYPQHRHKPSQAPRLLREDEQGETEEQAEKKQSRTKEQHLHDSHRVRGVLLQLLIQDDLSLHL